MTKKIPKRILQPVFLQQGKGKQSSLMAFTVSPFQMYNGYRQYHPFKRRKSKKFLPFILIINLFQCIQTQAFGGTKIDATP